MSDLDQLKSDLVAAINTATSLDMLEEVRLHALGKKGVISAQLKTLGSLEPDQRKQVGQDVNTLKEDITQLIADRHTDLSAAAMKAKISDEALDVSLPARPSLGDGRMHPLSRTIEEITAIFADMGFAIAEGPDIETDFYNFTALNIPPEHPARQEHDTFYLTPD